MSKTITSKVVNRTVLPKLDHRAAAGVAQHHRHDQQRDHQLDEREARVDEVADEAAHRTAVAGRQVLLVAGLHRLAHLLATCRRARRAGRRPAPCACGAPSRGPGPQIGHFRAALQELKRLWLLLSRQHRDRSRKRAASGESRWSPSRRGSAQPCPRFLRDHTASPESLRSGSAHPSDTAAAPSDLRPALSARPQSETTRGTMQRGFGGSGRGGGGGGGCGRAGRMIRDPVRGEGDAAAVRRRFGASPEPTDALFGAPMVQTQMPVYWPETDAGSCPATSRGGVWSGRGEISSLPSTLIANSLVPASLPSA